MLDHLHRYLCTWLAPVLCFTAEEAWGARFGDDTSVHLQLFPAPPAAWKDDALAASWETIRAIRRRITVPIEEARKANTIGSSLQAAVELPLSAAQETLLDAAEWAEIAIVSCVKDRAGHGRTPSEGHARARREMRPLLASAVGSGDQPGAPGAVSALRGRGGVGAGVPARGMSQAKPHAAWSAGRGDRAGR